MASDVRTTVDATGRLVRASAPQWSSLPGLRTVEAWLAVVLVTLAPFTGPAGLGGGFISLGLLAALPLAPVLARRGFDSHRLTALVVALAACVPAGWVLTQVPATGDMPRTSNWLLWLTLPSAAALTVLVARFAVRTVGVAVTAVAYAGGTILEVLTTETPRLDDPWWIKTRLAWPLVLALLALGHRSRRAGQDWLAWSACVVVALAAEYRSLLMFLGAGALVVLVARRHRVTSLTGTRVALFGAGVVSAVLLLYQAFAWAALSGHLGQEIALRSQRQIELGGTLLAGARIETPATLALMADRPLGFGPGFVPGTHHASIVLGALPSAATDDAVAAYVHGYILGDPVRLHSILGDLWFLFGLVGVVSVVALLLVTAESGVAWYRDPGRRLLTIVFLLWMSWDVIFSPAYSNLIPGAFLAALLLPARVPEGRLATMPRTGPERTGGRDAHRP